MKWSLVRVSWFALAVSGIAIAQPPAGAPVAASRSVSLPTAIANPAPVAPFFRLQPRRVTASSYLANGWNQFEQNYLPPYVADDDPATAWVEGVPGNGEGEHLEWFGPSLQGPHSVQLFLRNGYQKSTRLYLANSRPRRVRIEALRTMEGGIVVAAPGAIEQELSDATGWQQVNLTVSDRFVGLRLTLLSVYPGTAYNDTCVSDIRVYCDVGEQYAPEIEARFGDEVREFAAERQAAAKSGAARAHAVILPTYARVGEPLKVPIGYRSDFRGPISARWNDAVTRLGTVAPETAAAILKVSKALATYDALSAAPESKIPAGWQRVRVNELIGSRTAQIALGAARDASHGNRDALPTLAAFLHRGDFAAFEDSSASQELARTALAAWNATGWPARDDDGGDATRPPPDPTCINKCRGILNPPWTALEAALKASGESASLAEVCHGECDTGVFGLGVSVYLESVVAAGTLIQGATAAPSALFRNIDRVVGERETFRERHRELIVYGDARAVAVLTVDDADFVGEFSTRAVIANVLQWSPLSAEGHSRLVGFQRFSLDLEGGVPYLEITSFIGRSA